MEYHSTDIKNSVSLAIFKRKIRKWVPVNCTRRLCLNYVEGVGFI